MTAAVLIGIIILWMFSGCAQCDHFNPRPVDLANSFSSLPQRDRLHYSDRRVLDFASEALKTARSRRSAAVLERCIADYLSAQKQPSTHNLTQEGVILYGEVIAAQAAGVASGRSE